MSVDGDGYGNKSTAARLMKTIVSGGRDRTLTEKGAEFLETLGITVLLTGGATGIDTAGKVWAERKGIPVVVFPANWEYHGKAAGPIRNKLMAEFAEAAVIFRGGKGTQHMFQTARNRGLHVIDTRDMTEGGDMTVKRT